MTPDSPYAQYWLTPPTPDEAAENTRQWRALVSMRSAVRDGGGYASDRATAIQRRWEWLRWMVASGRLSEFGLHTPGVTWEVSAG